MAIANLLSGRVLWVRLADQSAWDGVEIRKNPRKWLGEVFWTHGAQVPQESRAPCPTLFCTGANAGCTGARGFSLPRSIGPKDLLHPLLTTFGDLLAKFHGRGRGGVQLLKAKPGPKTQSIRTDHPPKNS